MSLTDVRSSYRISKNPNEEVIARIANLIEIIPKCVAEKKELLHILNKISIKNKEEWLPKFYKFTREKWKEEYNSILISTIRKQSLYVDIYVEMLSFFTELFQIKILTSLLKCNESNSDMCTLGQFVGKWTIKKNMSKVAIEVFFGKIYEDIPGVVIGAFLILAKEGFSGLIPMNLYENLKQKKMETRVRMLLYDLEDILEQ